MPRTEHSREQESRNLDAVPHAADLEGASILAVDDEPINLRLLKAHLGKRGFAVSEAQSGPEALDMARAEPPDLILLDIMMPGMDGLETCRRLKEDERTRDVPVIFLSALTDSEIKTRGLESGGVDYVNKPFDSRELLARVRTHLLLRRQARQIRRYADNLEEMVEERTRKLGAAERELQRDYDIQALINTLLRFTLDDIPLQELLQRTLEHILDVPWLSFQARGCVFLADNGNRVLRMAAQHNLDPKVAHHCAELPYGECVCGRTALDHTLKLVRQDDPEHELDLDNEVPHSHYCVPIVHGQELLGVFNIYLKPDHRPDRKEDQFLTAVAHTLARLILYKQAEERLKDSEQNYRTIFQSTGTAMAILEPDGAVSLVNDGFEHLSGLERGDLEGAVALLDFVYEADQDAVRRAHAASRAGDGPDGDEPAPLLEFRFLSREAGQRHVTMAMAPMPGTGQTVVSLSDVTDRRRAEEQLYYHAFHDTLTGLPNRTMLLDRLAEAVEEERADSSKRFAVLLLDLDRFNIVNESLGHDIGDRLLVALAGRIKTCLGPGDLLARLGGDEFAVLATDMDDHAYATALAESVLEATRQPFSLEGHRLFTTSSIGIALSSPEYARGEDVLRDADTALHRAKLSGKARYEIFDQEMHRKARALMQMVTDMRLALERDEFLLHYQPIVDLRRGLTTGVEALVRWNHPQRGLVSPGEFIPVAEETGLIIPLGAWVLEQALTGMMQCFETAMPGRCAMVSVNLSGKQFGQEGIFEQVSACLERTGFDPACLKLEITESVIMENASAAVDLLGRLKSLNLQLSIDDFGTGYSSLSYLQRFPVDMLKIDRGFVMGMENAPENRELVRTIVALAHNMDLQVIAEGVETAEQARMLREMGCAYAQGFWFARPMDERALLDGGYLTRSWDLP